MAPVLKGLDGTQSVWQKVSGQETGFSFISVTSRWGRKGSRCETKDGMAIRVQAALPLSKDT